MIHTWDYVSPNFLRVSPDHCFPEMIIREDRDPRLWIYWRCEVPHRLYVDRRHPNCGFVTKDEAHILYNTALRFVGQPALEIGCWMGWSACHLTLGGVRLDVVDPLLEKPLFRQSVESSLKAAGVLPFVNLVSGYSPQVVHELAQKQHGTWSLFFIDGNHHYKAVMSDTKAAEAYAAENALILFHDLASPEVTSGLAYLRSQGWHTRIYQTMQILGVAWRGKAVPVDHQPDPRVQWTVPEHLKDFQISQLPSEPYSNDKAFLELVSRIKGYTMVKPPRLYSIFLHAKSVCELDLPGDFVECGVWRGGITAMLAMIIVRYSKRPRKVYAFDTFAGLPEPEAVDIHNGVPAKVNFSGGALCAPKEEFLDVICAACDVSEIVVPVAGLFRDTLPEYTGKMGPIAFVHADGDWYESTMDILDNLYDCMTEESVMQLDDYGYWEGCRKAYLDFEKKRQLCLELTQIDAYGVWFRKP